MFAKVLENAGHENMKEELSRISSVDSLIIGIDAEEKVQSQSLSLQRTNLLTLFILMVFSRFTCPLT